MNFGAFLGQNLPKKAKNEIFDFSVRSHQFYSTSYCSTKTSQIWYHSIDNLISHINKPGKTNFQKMLKILSLPLENWSRYKNRPLIHSIPTP